MEKGRAMVAKIKHHLNRENKAKEKQIIDISRYIKI